MKYSTPNHDEEYPKPKRFKSLTTLGGERVKVYEDGSIEATAFIDKTDDDLDYECDNKNGEVFFRKNINEDIKIKYTPSSFKVMYEAVCKKAFSIANCFAKFTGKIASFSIKQLGRYKHADRVIKKEADTLIKANKRFVFTDTIEGKRYIPPHAQSVILGPYNYPVKLKTDRDIDTIKDMIVIRTGSFGSGINKLYQNDSEIVYISPHTLKSSTGVYYTSDGLNLAGNYAVTTGQGLSAGITSGETHWLTSEDYSIPKGSYLSTTTTYNYYSPNAGNELPSVHYGSLVPKQTLFPLYNPKHAEKLKNISWDGVIPSGAWFSIESWSSNDQFIGFDGDILVEPVDSSLGITLNKTITATGTDAKDYNVAYANAEKAADKKFYREVNKQLVSNGVKNKNAKTKIFDRMVLKSAQGYYDKINNKFIEDPVLEKASNPTGEGFAYVEKRAIINDTASQSTKSSATSSSTTSSSTTY